MIGKKLRDLLQDILDTLLLFLAAECIGCGACGASCKNGSYFVLLFFVNV
jgi:ferredoxin